ncbi:hypothetical protein E2562_026844 [Oryza meyeriana var. granulata]|uniref:Uncharacterized protein n=1 Tax=Oryza meyeriana var. granulata TaxID=110450 RepID=A0A6G1D867_9ORYZ|nr:hypothetical protein E2562_026844 [Oryza meyeriana var. granulata]
MGIYLFFHLEEYLQQTGLVLPEGYSISDFRVTVLGTLVSDIHDMRQTYRDVSSNGSNLYANRDFKAPK